MLLNPIRLKPLSFWCVTTFLALLLSLLNAGFLGTAAFADDDQEVPTIPLSEVKQNIGKTGIVLMTVNSGHLLGDQKIAFLNSKTDYKDADNFTVVIKGDGLKAFADKKIENPANHYQGKKIRVTGKIVEYKNKPQIVVVDPLQIIPVLEVEVEDSADSDDDK